MKGKNKCPKVVQSPTKYTGGKNASPKVVQSPTKYKGGKSDPLPKVKPSK